MFQIVNLRLDYLRCTYEKVTGVQQLEGSFENGFFLGAACDPKISSGHIFYILYFAKMIPIYFLLQCNEACFCEGSRNPM